MIFLIAGKALNESVSQAQGVRLRNLWANQLFCALVGISTYPESVVFRDSLKLLACAHLPPISARQVHQPSGM